MSKKTNRYYEKPKEKRLKEAEKQLAEVERSKSVVLAKAWHGLIEEIEKLRKAPKVRSLMWRIIIHCETLRGMISVMSKFLFPTISLTSSEINRVRDMIDTYKSIREDFKEVTKIGEEKFTSLFPERHTYFETREQALDVLGSIFEQETQMLAYLLREVK